MSFLGNFASDDELRSPEARSANQAVIERLDAAGHKEFDFEFLTKVIPVVLSILTRVMHEQDPHNEEDHQGECEHMRSLQAMLGQTFTEGVALGFFGPAELAAMVKAAVTAMALGMKLAGYDRATTPGEVLMELLQDFNPKGWEEIEAELLEAMVENRDHYIQEKLKQALLEQLADRMGEGEFDLDDD